MKKGKALRLGGFLTAVCATAGLVAFASQSTGAWFSDSQGGTITGNSGHLKLLVNAGSGYTDTPGPLNLTFANLMPGTNADQKVNYQVDVSSGMVDLWLVFDTTTKVPSKDGGGLSTTAYQLFTGGGANPGADDNGMGRYGYFSVSDSNGVTGHATSNAYSNGTIAFQTGNLKFPDASNTPGMSGACPTDASGRGGNTWIATDANSWNHPGPYCGVPAAIELANNLTAGQTGAVTITLGLDGYGQSDQYQPNDPYIGYHLVATQAGHTPWDGKTAYLSSPPPGF